MPAWSVKTRHAPSRQRRDARVYGHRTTAMHEYRVHPPPTPPPPPRLQIVYFFGAVIPFAEISLFVVPSGYTCFPNHLPLSPLRSRLLVISPPFSRTTHLFSFITSSTSPRGDASGSRRARRRERRKLSAATARSMKSRNACGAYTCPLFLLWLAVGIIHTR